MQPIKSAAVASWGVVKCNDNTSPVKSTALLNVAVPVVPLADHATVPIVVPFFLSVTVYELVTAALNLNVELVSPEGNLNVNSGGVGI